MMRLGYFKTISHALQIIMDELNKYAHAHGLSLTRAVFKLYKDRNSIEVNYLILRVLENILPEKYHKLIPKRFKYYWLLRYGGLKTVVNSRIDRFASFEELWDDGFITPPITGVDLTEGVTGITHNGLDYHEIFQNAIKPYISKANAVLEIGCGRGAWTKGLLHASEVWCMDAQSLGKNGILKYLGFPNNLHYIQVSDYACKDIPDNYFDFLWSYDCFCHIELDGIQAYLQNLYPKLKTGALGIIMISDWDKIGRTVDDANGGTFNNFQWYPGCWVPNNIERMSKYLKDARYEIIDSDFLSLKRDTLVKFRKP